MFKVEIAITLQDPRDFRLQAHFHRFVGLPFAPYPGLYLAGKDFEVKVARVGWFDHEQKFYCDEIEEETRNFPEAEKHLISQGWTRTK